MDPSQLAAYNPNIQGCMSSAQDSTMQARLCGWLPPLDVKPLFKIEEMAPMQWWGKNILRNDQMKMFFAMSQTCSHLPFGMVLAQLWDLLAKSGRDITNLAHDLIPAELQQALLDHNVEGMDASHMRSMIGQMALQNVAMNAAAMHHDDGMSV